MEPYACHVKMFTTRILLVTSRFLIFLLETPNIVHARNGFNYYGTLIGSLSQHGRAINGTVFAIDESTLFIKGFYYDGTGVEACFWVGNASVPSPEGILVPYREDDRKREPSLFGLHKNEDIILKLPYNYKIRDIKWLSVWCRRFAVSFGEIYLSPDLKIASPRILPGLSRMVNGLRSDNITVLDSKTFYIPNLHYDGAGPGVYFLVGNGSEPNRHGIKVPNEINSLQPLRGYEGVDIEIVLPGNLTVYDIDWLAIWCEKTPHNYGHVMIPKDLEVPPALGQTKIAPPWWYIPTSSTQPPESNKELSNCIELMRGRVQVQWELINDTVQIRVSAKIKEDQYVAFGLSASEGKPEFLGSDVVLISYNNRTNEFIAEDYYMSDFSQCDGQQGICPDNHIGGKNDVVLISGSRNNGITSVTFRRPLQTTELIRDKIIPKNKTSIIAAIGMLNADGKPNARHGFEKTTVDIQIDFTSHGVKQCTDSPHSISNDSETRAWSKSKIFGKDTFTARIGPTNIGSKRGIKFIPGSPLGIAWYIDDQLTPEIIVERGKNYTFLVEGGNDVNSSTRYHPFYITDNPEGGFEQKRRREQMEQKLYAGVAFGVDGFPYPTAAGRYCEWSYKNIDPGPLSNFKNFFETLKLDCEPGEPAKLLWLVAEETPDTVYYQCYRHNNLGWKIQVINDAALTFSPLLMITYVLLHNLLRFVT